MKKIFCIAFIFAAFNLNNLVAAKKKDFPEINLESKSRADLALDKVKDKLPDLAEWYGYSVSDFTKLLKDDRTLWLDAKGRLFVEDDAPILGLEPSPENASTLDTSIPLTETFLLHSKPGSSKVIYLDFNGHLIPANSAWASSYNAGNAINAPAFSTDADLNNFSNSELQIIQNVWRLVAEDFAAFDVDVTTEEPPSSALVKESTNDNSYGARILISPISSYFGNYGGIAYVGVFDNIGDYYQPALVFPEKLGNSAKNIGEASSHEVGHNLGLNHDGTTTGTTYYTGHGNWAPIMGVAYSKSIAQWSRGEYANANNTQDDFLVMGQNGLFFKADDHGNSIASASLLNINNGNASQSGVIQNRTDVDYFSFNTAAGGINLNITPSQYSPNLDISASLYDSLGNLILNSNPSGLAANLATTLASGTYFVSVDGIGFADPLSTGYSDYSSLGFYSITGTIPNGQNLSAPTAIIQTDLSSGYAPLTVNFVGSNSTDSDGSITAYAWNFGDNSSSSLANLSKTFTNPGSYSVTLTVTDNDGLINTATKNISVLNNPPNAVANLNLTTGIAPLTVTYNASASTDSDGSIAAYAWNFGDGGTRTNASGQYIFNNPGTYNVTLTVTDNSGTSDTDTVQVIVSANPNYINPPTNLTVSSPNRGAVVLNWLDNSTNETNFAIERAVKPKGNQSPAFTEIARTALNVKTYTDSVAANTYIYRVRGINTSNNAVSNYSNQVSIRVR